MKVLGLCGGSGSGKGLLSVLFNELGILSIDTDKVYHTLISTDSKCTMELVKAFGNEIHAKPGIDRDKLRTIAFASQKNLEVINSITHKHILKKVREEIKNIESTKKAKGVLIDAPLLFESGFDRECDITICVIADNESRIKRILERDNITFEDAKRRIDSQIDNQTLINKCTYCVENNSTVQNLKEQVKKLYNTIFD